MATKSIEDLFKTDSSLETEGIEIKYGEHGSFFIARAGGANKAFNALMTKKLRPYRTAMQMGTMDDSVLESVVRECFAEKVVLGWDLVDSEGNAIPFSKQKCVELFNNLPDLFTDLMQESQRVANFVQSAREEDAKN